MQILKIFRQSEWDALVRDGRTDGAPIDIADGYIHFSTSDQVIETAAKHFAGVPDLVLAGVEAGTLGDDLKWEVSRGGAMFPHLYRALNHADVAWCEPLPLDNDGTHKCPELPK